MEWRSSLLIILTTITDSIFNDGLWRTEEVGYIIHILGIIELEHHLRGEMHKVVVRYSCSGVVIASQLE